MYLIKLYNKYSVYIYIYIYLYIFLCFGLSIIVVNEEFYVSLGLLICLINLYGILFVNFLTFFNNDLKTEYKNIVIFYISYYKFLIELRNFFVLELNFWVYLYYYYKFLFKKNIWYIVKQGAFFLEIDYISKFLGYSDYYDNFSIYYQKIFDYYINYFFVKIYVNSIRINFVKILDLWFVDMLIVTNANRFDENIFMILFKWVYFSHMDDK